MSVVVAVFNRDQASVDPVVVEKMMLATTQRPWDGQAVWQEGHIALAHQHFWVTAEEKEEEQPIVALSGRVILACDARLDNRPELITRLNSHQGMSDAQLILLAYQKWGIHCPEQLLGDFALLIWDKAQQWLFMARDSLGCRNLSYYLDSHYCLVASEIAPLLAHPAVCRRLNEGKIAEYLVGLWNDQEESFYQNIAYCPPAHCLLVSTDRVQKWRYWDIDPHRQLRYRQDREYGEHFEQLLITAVSDRLRLNGPVGISLSGGLDSTTIAAIAAPLTPGLKSFSYVFDELTACDEREWIRPVVEEYGLEATYLPADDLWTLRDFERWPNSPDFIFHDAYVLLPLAIIQAAQQSGCRLVLNGHFGDTLFTGSRFWVADMLTHFQWANLARISYEQWRGLNFRAALFDNGLRQLLPVGLRQRYRQWRPRPEQWPHPGLHPDLARRTNLQERRKWDTSWQTFGAAGQWERYRTLNAAIFAQASYVAQALYQSYGVEVVSPFWDRRLVEFVMAVPAYQLGVPGRTKRLLRNGMSGRLPTAVRERPGKTSFTPLFQRGLYQRERATVQKMLDRPQVVSREYIRLDWLVQSADTLDDSAYYFWLTISLEQWLKRYFGE